MDVRANVNLTYLWLYSNRLAEIDLTKNAKLELLQLQKNRLARVRLCIDENVQKQEYLNQDWFNLSDQ